MRLAAGCALLAAVAGCDNDIPTAVGGDLFPRGARPNTVELVLPADQFIEEIGRFGGYTDIQEIAFLLVASEFGGALDAHTLARFTGFPETVTYSVDGESQTDSAFVYGSGQVVAPIDSAASASAGPVTLQLWTLTQSWDPGTVTWELASDTAGSPSPWVEPGGTRGRLLAEVTRVPGDTVTRDSVAWTVDSLTVAEMAAEDFPGLLVTATNGSARIQLDRLSLRTSLHPEERPDTAVEQTISSGPQEFVFTPDPPDPPADTWQVGGVTGPRVLLRLGLPSTVPGCRPGGPDVEDQDCGPIPLDEVQINEAALLLDPLPVGGGFRPTAPIGVALRAVGEPELGRLAPLGSVVAGADAPSQRFEAATDSAIVLPLTNFLRTVAATDTTSITAALLSEPPAGNFGVARFDTTPRLRLVYTLPLISAEP